MKYVVTMLIRIRIDRVVLQLWLCQEMLNMLGSWASLMNQSFQFGTLAVLQV